MSAHRERYVLVQRNSKMEPVGSYYRCSAHHPNELLVVEGKHAANAVNRVRHRGQQAIVAMQGKVPNVVRQGLARCLESNEHVGLLARVLGSPDQRATSRAGSGTTVVVISDPDADGIHASLLLLCLIAELAPDVVANSRLLLCRSPLALISHADDMDEPVPAYHENELQAGLQIQRFKGLASLPLEVLSRCCVDPQTRAGRTVTVEDCNIVRQQFSRLPKQ